MSAEDRSTPSAGSTFNIPPSLADFCKPATTFCEQDSSISGVAVGALVFHDDRLLLVQRSAHDSFPGKWEIPGGGCDVEDPTILHSAARELQEETGLRAASIVRVVGDGITFTSRSGRTWLKHVFEIEVEPQKEQPGEVEDRARDDNKPPYTIKIDPKEHQDYCWATLKEIEAALVKNRALVLEFVSPEQRRELLRGFEKM